MGEVTRELTNAHFLHEKGGLEALVRPPVEEPTCLAWRPRSEQLLVGNRKGEVFEVDPVMGTTRRGEGLGWTTTLAIHPDNERFLVMNADGGFSVHRIGEGEPIHEGEHGFTRRMSAFFHREYAVMAGDAPEGRYVLILAGGRIAARIQVPHRAIPMIGTDDKLKLVRSTQAGLRVQNLSRDPKVDDLESTAHHLRAFDDIILGYTVIGLVAWPRGEGGSVSMRMADLGVATLSPDGQRVGLGTRSGAVAMARLRDPHERARPDMVRAFDGPVKAVEFAPKGRWLATAGDTLVLWTWED
jgi:hypothetical protein